MKMLNLFMILGLFFSVNGNAYNRNYKPYSNGVILKSPDGSSIFIPKNKSDTSPQKELKGQGVVFNTFVKVTEEKALDDDGKPTLVKKYKAWVRHCHDVDLPEKKDQHIKNGDRIELKFDRAESCTVMDWKKF